MGDGILGIAKNVKFFFGPDGYPTTEATTEDDLKKKFNALLRQAKEDKIELNAENLIEMLGIAAATPAAGGGAAATPAVPGGAIKQIAARIVIVTAATGSSTTQEVEEAKLMAKLLNTALIDDKRSDKAKIIDDKRSDKAKTIAATLKERGVALEDAGAALNQRGLRLDSKGKFKALWELYNDETDIDIAVAAAWGGLPGTAGGPAAATDYNSLNKRLEELKATGIELTPENLIEMLDIAAATPAVPGGAAATAAVPGGAIKQIAPGGPGDEVGLMARVLNNCLVDEDNKHKIISDVLDKKGVNLEKIDIKLPKLYKDAKEFQDAAGYGQLYKDAVYNNHITKKDKINKFTAALVKHRRDQERKISSPISVAINRRGWNTIGQNDFVDMMVITCKAYQERGASDTDVQDMLKSFANQYAGFYHDDAWMSKKQEILKTAAKYVLEDDAEVETILRSVNPTTKYYMIKNLRSLSQMINVKMKNLLEVQKQMV